MISHCSEVDRAVNLCGYSLLSVGIGKGDDLSLRVFVGTVGIILLI